MTRFAGATALLVIICFLPARRGSGQRSSAEERRARLGPR